MISSPRTRSDFKRAGRAFGQEQAAVLAEEIKSWTEAALNDDARIDAALLPLLKGALIRASSYQERGVSEPRVAAFWKAYLHTFIDRMDNIEIAARMKHPAFSPLSVRH